MNYATDPWYEERRNKVMQAVSSGKPLKGKKEKRQSSSGKYTLELTPYSVKDNKFPYYSVVEIIRTSDGERMGKVIRNEADFPFLFVEEKDGKDYLLCAEDYQGFTVINLTDGIKHDYIAEKSKRGLALRITDFYLSQNRKNLALEGFAKNKPNDIVETDEIHFYIVEDFMKVPYVEVDKRIVFAYDKVIGWESDEKLLISIIEDHIVPTGICLDDIKDPEERIDHLRKGNIKKQTAYYSYIPNTGKMHRVFSEWR
jgi:hypothetical protein